MANEQDILNRIKEELDKENNNESEGVSSNQD